MLLLRWLKRRSAFREENFEDTFLAEFRKKNGAPDTSLSVYEIGREELIGHEIVQIHTEHAFGCLSRPSPHFMSVDVTGFSGPNKLATPGTTGFEFTTQAHRELEFSDENALRAFARALCDSNPRRTMESRPSEIRAYVLNREAADDPEWRGKRETKKDWDKWMRRDNSGEKTSTSSAPKSQSKANENGQFESSAQNDSPTVSRTD